MDRTSELLQYIRSASGDKPAATPQSRLKSRSAFQDAAGEIARGINRCSQTLGKLSKLVQRQGLFDDPTEEINALIFRVKQELGELNSKCDTAQQYVDSQRRGRSSVDIAQGQGAHHGKVVSQLKHGLADATRDFKATLEARSSKMKDQQTRKEALTGAHGGMLSPASAKASKFGGGGGGGFDGGNNANANTAASTAFRSAMPATAGGGTRAAAGPYGGGADMYSQDYSSNGGFGGERQGSQTAGQDQQQQQRLLLAPPVQYYEAREQAVVEVESTISELGQLFKRLTTMIQEQGEMVERIDEDIESASASVSSASEQLQKAYDAASSNSGLYAKLGGILLFFLVFFSVFLL
jgi:syntaxin 5